MAVKIRQRPDGSGIWWIFIDHHGRRKAKKIGRDKRLAQEVARKIEARLVLGDFSLDNESAVNRQMPSFKEYAELWLENYVKELRRESTYERYRDILKRYVYPILGKKPIDQIRRVDIRDLLLKNLNYGLARSTVSLVRDVISGVMGYAMDEELIGVNPVTGVMKKLGLDRKHSAPVEPMTNEEVNLVLQTCGRDYPEYYSIFAFCIQNRIASG